MKMHPLGVVKDKYLSWTSFEGENENLFKHSVINDGPPFDKINFKVEKNTLSCKLHLEKRNSKVLSHRYIEVAESLPFFLKLLVSNDRAYISKSFGVKNYLSSLTNKTVEKSSWSDM